MLEQFCGLKVRQILFIMAYQQMNIKLLLNQMSYWQEDFPAIEKYYIFKLGIVIVEQYFNGRKKIKEAQRLFP